MQGGAADDLHIVMPLPQVAAGGFAHDGEGLGQQLVVGVVAGEMLAELGGFRLQLGVGQGLGFFFLPVGGLFDGRQFFEGFFVGVA